MFWRALLIGLCLLAPACSSTRDFYEAVYHALQVRAKAKDPPDAQPFPDRPMSFQQYEAERKALLEPPDKPATGSRASKDWEYR